MSTDRTKLDYYAYGKYDRNIEIKPYTHNMGIKDTANTLLERNALALNSKNTEDIRNSYKSLHTLSELKKENNNYLNPIKNFNTNEKSTIAPNFINNATYKIYKKKLHAK
jgi:hypothetical protein